MNIQTVGIELITLTNGIIWEGYRPARDPEECDPLWVMWQHWQYSAELQQAAKREAQRGSVADDRAFEMRVEWAQYRGKDEFMGSIQS